MDLVFTKFSNYLQRRKFVVLLLLKFVGYCITFIVCIGFFFLLLGFIACFCISLLYDFCCGYVLFYYFLGYLVVMFCCLLY